MIAQSDKDHRRFLSNMNYEFEQCRDSSVNNFDSHKAYDPTYVLKNVSTSEVGVL